MAVVTVASMTDTQTKKRTHEVRTFPGPKLFLVSGYNSDELKTLAEFLESVRYKGVEIKYCTLESLNDTIETVLTSDTLGEPADSNKLPNTMLFSGMTTDDVKMVMTRFSECKLNRPIFATTTPTNLGFTVKELLRHLLEEQRAAGAYKPSPKK